MARKNGHVGAIPTVPILLGGKTRHLRVDFNALADAEEATGLNLLDVAEWGRVNATRLRAILWAMLKHEDDKLTLADVGAMLTGRNAQQALESVNRALAAAEGADPKGEGSGSGPSPDSTSASATTN